MGARIRHGFHKASARPWRQHLELQWRLPPPGKWNLFLSCAKLESSFDLAVMDPPGVCPHLFSGRKVSSPCCCSGATELAIVFNWTKEDQFQKNLLDDGTVYIYYITLYHLSIHGVFQIPRAPTSNSPETAAAMSRNSRTAACHKRSKSLSSGSVKQPKATQLLLVQVGHNWLSC